MTIEMANTRFYRDVIPYDEMLYAVIMFVVALASSSEEFPFALEKQTVLCVLS